jgi:hypothetical protein
MNDQTALTEDALTWYGIEKNPPTNAELLVETPSGYFVILSTDPWPFSTWRWAKLPQRLTQGLAGTTR